MNPAHNPIEITDFSGGLNTGNPSYIEDNECSVLENVVFSLSGQLRSRPGTLLQFSELDTGATFVGAYQYPDNDFSPTFFYSNGIYSATGTKLKDHYAYTTEPALGLDQYSVVYAEEIYLVGTDYSEVVKATFDGPGETDYSYTLIDSTPRSVVAVFKDRMFYTRETSPERLYFSDIGDFATTDPTSFIDILGNDLSGVTALIPFNDVLFIFKKNSIWTLYANGDVSNWTLRLSDTSRGALNRKCVAVQANTLYFIDKFGLYLTDGVSYQNVGSKITDEFLSRSQGIEDAFLHPYRDHMLMQIETAYDSGTFFFDLNLSAFTKWTFIESGIANLTLIDGTYYFGRSEGSYGGVLLFDDAYGFDDTVADGGAVGSEFYLKLRTKMMHFGAVSDYKRAYWAFCDVLCDSLEYQFHAESVQPESYTSLAVDVNEEGSYIKLNAPSAFRRLAAEVKVPSDYASGNLQAQIFSVGVVLSPMNHSAGDNRG